MTQFGQATPRHLVFVLEGGEIVVQRKANEVEVLETHEQRVFSDFDRDHDVTDVELQSLLDREIILGFDEMTVWLPRPSERQGVCYYFLDTQLSPAYLQIVNHLIEYAALAGKYVARDRMGRVAIMDSIGEPFASLPDAEAALTLVRTALGDHLSDMRIESIEVDTNLEEAPSESQQNFADLIRETPITTLADYSVLVVENESRTADEARLALENLGVQVRVVQSGETALDVLLDEEPDLVLIDLMLPDMHGYEVIARIRKDPLTAKTPVIAMSANSTEADVVFALHVAKVDDYLVKPIGPNVLRHRVLALLNRAL